MATKNNPIGRGILCPFMRDGKGDFANTEGLPVLKSDIGELLGIVGPTVTQPGELPWDGGRGSRLLVLKHRGIHSEMVRAMAEHMSSGVIRSYETRVRVGQTRIVIDGTALRVTVSYIPLGYANVEPQYAEISPIG
jgi:hypothetical protein